MNCLQSLRAWETAAENQRRATQNQRALNTWFLRRYAFIPAVIVCLPPIMSFREDEMKSRTPRYVATIFAVAFLLLAHTGFEAQGQFDRWSGRVVTGTAYYFGAFRGAQTRSFSLNINHLSSAAEVDQL